MEKWIADRPHHPGEAAKQWLKDLSRRTSSSTAPSSSAAAAVDLKNITCPVLNVCAKDDHIIPPATSQALGSKVGSSDYSELGLPGGHVGVFVGGEGARRCSAPASPIGWEARLRHGCRSQE